MAMKFVNGEDTTLMSSGASGFASQVVRTNFASRNFSSPAFTACELGESGGARTLDTLLKRQVL